MKILSTQINGFIIDTLNPMARMLRSTAQKAQQLDDQYFGPVNTMIAEYRETVTADYSAYLGEWMTFVSALSACVLDCTAPQRTALMSWAEEVEGNIAQFDWLGFTLSTVDKAFTTAQFAADVLAVVWVVASFLWVTFSNHVADPYEGSDFAAQVRLHQQEMKQHQALSRAVNEAIAESQARMRGINPDLMDLDWDMDMGAIDAFNDRFQLEETASNEFDPLVVLAKAFAETVPGVKDQPQPQPVMVVA